MGKRKQARRLAKKIVKLLSKRKPIRAPIDAPTLIELLTRDNELLKELPFTNS